MKLIFYTCLQLDALKVMLNLNLPISSSVAHEPVWKLFIYDRSGQDIVSPLLTVKELRDFGVTLHMYVLVLSVYINIL